MTAPLHRIAALGLALAGSALAPAGRAHAEPTAPSALGAPNLLDGKAMLAVVSIRDQRISLYDADGGVLRAKVSSGMGDYETPVGVYAILQKKEQHTSNLYDDAEMPFMQRITWSGIALHAGQLPGRPASHGCVRMPYGYSEQIFPLTKLGMRVVVAYADVAPVPITHSLLFQPASIEETAAATPIAYEPDVEAAARSPFEADVNQWPARQALLDSLRPDAVAKAQTAEAATARADEVKKREQEKSAARAKTAKALKRAEAARRKADDEAARAARWLETAKSKSARTAQRAEESAAKTAATAAAAAEKQAQAQALHSAAETDLAAAATELAAAEAAKTAAVTAANEAKRKMLPVSVFVSRAAQRLYVRQGHAPVLDVPVTIADPETPIGTYVYTAVGYDAAGNTARWTAVSTGPREGSDGTEARRRSRKSAAHEAPPPTDLAGATAALDRITLPADLGATLFRYVWPGSSLIVSDEEISKETGEATDFVVLISSEPQGGIKKRPRRPPMDDDYYYDDRYYEDYQRYYDRRRRPRYNPPFFSFW